VVSWVKDADGFWVALPGKYRCFVCGKIKAKRRRKKNDLILHKQCRKKILEKAKSDKSSILDLIAKGPLRPLDKDRVVRY